MVIHTFSRLSLMVARIAVLLVLLGSCVFLHLHEPALLKSITEMIKHHPMGTTVFRWGIVCVFVLLWPSVVKKIGRHYGATPEQIADWSKKRVQIGLWLILIELVVFENLVSKMLHGFGSV